MSKELIERLRNNSHLAQRDGFAALVDTCGEAATLLERQSEMLEKAREALSWIVKREETAHSAAALEMAERADACLKAMEQSA